MKLTEYINESNVSAAQEGIRISKNIIKKLFEKLKKRSFVYASSYDIVKDLNQITPKKIKFISNTRQNNIGRYLSYATYDYQYGKIVIEVTNKLADYFRRFAKENKESWFFDEKKNQFYKELLEIVSHELVHKLQHMKAKNIKPFREEEKEGMGGYLSLQVEIDAFAIQAALQIINGDRSSIWDAYSSYKAKGEITDKVYNRFMKKVYSNIRELKKLGMIK